MNNPKTAVQEIQEAIESLTAMRNEREYQEMNGWLVETVEGASGAIYDPGYAPLTNDELIVTLFRTIDALLVTLQWGVDIYKIPNREHPTPLETRVLALARAINGESE